MVKNTQTFHQVSLVVRVSHWRYVTPDILGKITKHEGVFSSQLKQLDGQLGSEQSHLGKSGSPLTTSFRRQKSLGRVFKQSNVEQNTDGNSDLDVPSLSPTHRSLTTHSSKSVFINYFFQTVIGKHLVDSNRNCERSHTLRRKYGRHLGPPPSSRVTITRREN